MRTRVFVLTWLAYAGYYLCRKGVSVGKAPLREKLGLSELQLGQLDTGYLAAYALGQFSLGYLGDALGPRVLLGLGMGLAAACTAGAGLSTSLGMLTVAWTLNGLFQASGWPGTMKALTPRFERAERGRIMGLWSTSYQLGSMIAGALAAWLLAHLGLTASFVVPAVMLAGIGLGVALGLPPSPALPSSQRGALQLELLRNPTLWLLGAAYFGLKLIRYTLLFWLPYYLEKSLGVEREAAGYQSLAFEAGGAVGAVLVGYLSDRHLQGRRALAGLLGCVGLAGALFVYQGVAGLGVVPRLLGLALVGLMLFGPDSLISAAASQDLGGGAASGTAAGFINGMGSVGAVLQGWLTATVAARYGWPALFTVLWVLALGSALALWPAWRREVQHRPAPAPAPTG